MKYKIIETEKGQREKVYKGNTMLYKKTKIEYDSNITGYEMVVTYYEIGRASCRKECER